MPDVKDELWPPALDARRTALVESAAANDLEGGLFAIEGADDETAEGARATLISWAAAARAHRPEQGDDAAYAALFRAMSQADVRGDDDDYHAVENSLLSRVVARRRGMPILLSAVWILVGRRLGVDVDGVALPGHFVARIGRRIFDPFRGGVLIDDATLQALVMRAAGRAMVPSDLAPASTAAILARVLRNLHASQVSSCDAVTCYRTAVLLAAVAKDDVGAHLAMARHAESSRAAADARRAYEYVLEHFSGEPRDAARAGIERLERWPRPN